MGNEFDFFKVPPYSKSQLTWLVILRIVIGWHIFYEGFS